MSRIGKNPILLPEGVRAEIMDGGMVHVTGPKGALSHKLHEGVAAKLVGNTLQVFPTQESRKHRALWGLNRTLVANMVEGVHRGFRKGLEIVGVGYRAEVREDGLHVSVGYSHPVVFRLPDGIRATVERQVYISLEGVDKYLVGETAARIRRVRPPDSYKGKGIRYQGEVLKLKESKKSAKK